MRACFQAPDTSRCRYFQGHREPVDALDEHNTRESPSKGSCGNIWFTKSSSWTRDLIGQPEDNPIVNKLPSNLPCVDEPKKTGCHDDRRRATTIGVIHDTNDALF